MRLNHQFGTTLQGGDLERVLRKYAAREYAYHRFEEYGVSNYSICLPNHLNILRDYDGYHLIAYEANQYQDYTVAPLTVTIRSYPLNLTSFQTTSDQRTFLKKVAMEMSQSVMMEDLDEIVIDGHPTMLMTEATNKSGVSTHAVLISHQRLLQISVLFRGDFTNMRQVTEDIIQSFKVHSTPSPQNATLTLLKSTYENLQLEISNQMKADVQYVISLPPTGCFFMPSVISRIERAYK